MKLQYLSHSCVKITAGKTCLLIDPFLTHNSKAPLTWQEAAHDVTHIALTHGHGDHVGDAVAISAQTGAPIIAMVELAAWLTNKHGVKKTEDLNLGGGVEIAEGVTVSLVPAWHSSASDDGTYLGNPAGLIIQTPTQTIYHAGDTCIFTDMALIEELYHPTIGLLPIGGRYTMDAKAAALAAKKFFNFKTIIPIHYATFGALAQTADAFVAAGQGLPIKPLKPGESLEF